MLKRHNAAREQCPACGRQEGAPLVFGYPAPATIAAVEHGEIALGGCCVGAPPWPDRTCRACGHMWRASARSRAVRSAVTSGGSAGRRAPSVTQPPE
jgi:hypothetical protein